MEPSVLSWITHNYRCYRSHLLRYGSFLFFNLATSIKYTINRFASIFTSNDHAKEYWRSIYIKYLLANLFDPIPIWRHYIGDILANLHVHVSINNNRLITSPNREMILYLPCHFNLSISIFILIIGLFYYVTCIINYLVRNGESNKDSV